MLLLAAWLTPTVSCSEIDFSRMPPCAWNSCFPYHSSAIGCPTFTKSCFCNVKAPVNCSSTNCTDGNWYAVEDWYDELCPNPPIVTLSDMPQCSRKCIREALIPRYCQSQLTRNCFCRLQSVFLGLTNCLMAGCREDSGNATETLADYYRRTCIYQPTQDGRGSSVGTNQDEVVSRPAETMGGQAKATGGPAEMAGGGDSQDNLGRTVGLVSGFLTFATAGVAVYICLSRHRVKVRDQEPL